MKTKLGLYIHVPFCKAKCSYCDFYSTVPFDDEINNFVKKISEHIEYYAKISSGYIIDTLYIGGGTPSVIGGENLSKIIKCAKKNFDFDKNCEITVELNPESTNKKLLKKLKKSKVNRLSFGVQSSDDNQLSNISRLHNFTEARDVIEIAKKIGFNNISVDLIYGLPNQTFKNLKNDIKNFVNLDVSHISTYALKIEEGTPMDILGTKALDDDLVADMYDEICEYLKQAGYEHYEISNFSKPGYHSRHNNKYWNLDEYLGLGPSAHSFYGMARFSFVADTNLCLNDMQIDEKEDKIPFNMRFGEYIMLKLRTKSGINTDDFYNTFRVDFSSYISRAEKFIDSGYAKYENGNFFLTEKGFYISNYIINELLKGE